MMLIPIPDSDGLGEFGLTETPKPLTPVRECDAHGECDACRKKRLAKMKERKGPEIHSAKAHRCVDKVGAKGHSESSAWAICNTSVGKSAMYAKGHGGQAAPKRKIHEALNHPFFESNDCHTPAGSSAGGQFCSKSGGSGGSGKSDAPIRRDDTGAYIVGNLRYKTEDQARYGPHPPKLTRRDRDRLDNAAMLDGDTLPEPGTSYVQREMERITKRQGGKFTAGMDTGKTTGGKYTTGTPPAKRMNVIGKNTSTPLIKPIGKNTSTPIFTDMGRAVGKKDRYAKKIPWARVDKILDRNRDEAKRLHKKLRKG